MARIRLPFSPQFKWEAAQLARRTGASVSQLDKELEYAQSARRRCVEPFQSLLEIAMQRLKAVQARK